MLARSITGEMPDALITAAVTPEYPHVPHAASRIAAALRAVVSAG